MPTSRAKAKIFAKRLARKQAGTVAPKPAEAYALTVPLAPSMRAVYEGLRAEDLNTLLRRSKVPRLAESIEAALKVQVLDQGRWKTASDELRDVGRYVALQGIAQRAAEASPLRRAAALQFQRALPVELGAAQAVDVSSLELSAPLGQLNTRLSAATGTSLSELRQLSVRVSSELDPRLQLAVINRRSGKQSAAISSAAGDEVPVIARVTSFEAWASLADVHPGAELGVASDGSIVATGRVLIDRVEAVRRSAAVRSMKASQPVQAGLNKTVETMAVSQPLLPKTVKPQGGKGVVVGIVDMGGDFVHQNFRNKDGSTRLLSLWHQGGVAGATSPFGYGRLFDKAEINAALATTTPYATLGYAPRPDSPSVQGAHGTHVMDIAAGNGAGTSFPGVAPEADLIFVEVAATDIAWSGPQATTQSFGDSVQMLEAIKFIFDQAGDRPCVVNLSLGTNGGPHDGTSLVEQGIDSLVNAKPNRAVVIAASNSQEDGIHTSGTVGTEATFDVGWTLIEEAGGEFELWYEGADRLEVELIGPDGVSVGVVQPASNLALGSATSPLIFISSRLDDPNNHCNVIGIWIADKLQGGDWTVRLRNLGAHGAPFHAWIERLDGSQSFFTNAVPSHTLGSISTGVETLVVGSYDAHKANFTLSSFSSSGPTRDGRQKPEISAPGGNVFAARSRTGNGLVRKSGTSMAAPAVTGLVALVFAEAARKGVTLSSQQLRDKVIAGVDPAPGVPPGRWDPRYGHGRASSKAI